MNNDRMPDQLGLVSSVEQNIYLAQESQIHLQEISLALHTLAKEVATTLAAKACCIYILDQKRQEIVPYAYWHIPDIETNFTKQTIDEGIVGLIAQAWYDRSSNKSLDRNLVRIDNLKEDDRFESDALDFPHNSVLVQPLVASDGERLLGVLLVADKIDLPTFLPQDEQLLATIVAQSDLTLAIQNLKLHQEKQHWVQGLTIITQINQALATFPHLVNIESTCRMVLSMSSLKDFFRFDIAEICLWDDQTETLTVVKRLPEDSTDVQTYSHTYRLNEGYTGWIATNQKSLLIGDTHHHDVTPKAGLDDFPYRSYIGAPLQVGLKFLGTLELAATPANFYDREDIAILEIVANQVAIVVDHARLQQETQGSVPKLSLLAETGPELSSALSDEGLQLQKRVGELVGLQRVSRELNSTLDLDRILNLVLAEAMQATRADFGNVDFYDPETGQLTTYKKQARPDNNQPETESPVSQLQLTSAQHSIIERALRTKKAILVPDLLNDEHFIDQSGDTRSLMVMPICYGGESVGVINLTSRQPNFFANDQLYYLETLANQVAVAIGNAQAFQEQKLERQRANRRVDQLSRLLEISNAFRTNCPLSEVLEDIAYAIMESVGYSVVFIDIVLGDPPVICHEVGAGIPVAQLEALQTSSRMQPLSNLEAIMLEEFRLGNAYFIPAERMDVWQDKLDIPYIEKRRRPDSTPSIVGRIKIAASENTWQTGDLLFVPLADTYDNIIGLLIVQDPDTNQRPDISAVQILEIFANHAAVAIENARLFALEQQRRRLADTLRGVAETISSQLALDELLNIVLQGLSKVVDYDKATVELLDENRLVIIGGQGWEEYSQQMIGLAFSMEGTNPSRLVLERQEPVIVKDIQEEYGTVFSAPPYDRIRSWLGVPLTYGTNVLGLVAVGSSQIDCFTEEDAEVIFAFANQVAVALQNARLFDETRQQVHHLATLTEVAQSINQALDLDEVLNLVLDAVFDLVGHSKGSIWLIDTGSNTVKIANTENIPDVLIDLFNESSISVDTEPFASVIESGQISVIKGSVTTKKDHIANYGLPFPDDVTYVPLETEDGVIGILAIETVIHNQNMLQLVTTLADLAAVAIDNAQLVQRLNLLTEELEERVAQRTQELARTLQDLTEERDRVETLYQITRELSTSLDLDRVLIEALNLINRTIGISHGSILLLDHGSGELVYRAALGRSKPLPRGGYKTKYKLGYGLAGTVMETREPRIIPDLSQDPDWIQNKETPDRRSAIAVPLATGEGLMGALLLFHPEVGFFTEDHLKLVSAAGTQIANAINNAELYRLITDQAERLGIMLRTQATEAAKNQAILEGIADGVLVLDAWRNIVLLNPKAAEILDIDPKEVKNQPVQQILEQTESPVESELRQLFYEKLLQSLPEMETGESSAEFRIEADNKAIVVTLTSVILGTEESLSVVAVLRDISKEAEIDRMKNEFISTVSHELRTPMTSIKGYADLLASGSRQVGELNSTQHRFVQVIQSNANRLTDLVNEILEISRIETGRVKLQFETLDIILLIKEVAISFEGQMVQKAMNLSLNLPDDIPDVYADKARLTQILVNLIGNAWQYTPAGGKITVYASVVDDNFVQIDVEDTGIGIPEKDIEYIFERFFRSERPEVQVVDGTGLGLSITKSFVEILGGKIWVKSQLDVGTTFSFTIPLASQQQQAPSTDKFDLPSESKVLTN